MCPSVSRPWGLLWAEDLGCSLASSSQFLWHQRAVLRICLVSQPSLNPKAQNLCRGALLNVQNIHPTVMWHLICIKQRRGDIQGTHCGHSTACPRAISVLLPLLMTAGRRSTPTGASRDLSWWTLGTCLEILKEDIQGAVHCPWLAMPLAQQPAWRRRLLSP